MPVWFMGGPLEGRRKVTVVGHPKKHRAAGRAGRKARKRHR